MGYDPHRFYSGRAPIEAAAKGLSARPDQMIFRCNLVTIEDGRMKDFTAGHISRPDHVRSRRRVRRGRLRVPPQRLVPQPAAAGRRGGDGPALPAAARHPGPAGRGLLADRARAVRRAPRRARRADHRRRHPARPGGRDGDGADPRPRRDRLHRYRLLGDAAEKVKALERIDEAIVGPLLEALRAHGPHRVFVAADHPTPVGTKTHDATPPPFCFAGSGIAPNGGTRYTEAEARRTGLFVDPGHGLMERFFQA